MSIDTGQVPATDYDAGRAAQLEEENAQLRRDLQALRAERDVARGAAQSAVAERVAAQEMAGQLRAEEHVTQRVLAEQNSNFTYVNVMLMMIFVLALALTVGMFAWLPVRMDDLRPRTTIAAPPPPGSPAPGYTVR
jgi:hypothetical protein